MALKVEIDPGSGFCGGVIRAITTAENYLSGHPGTPLYSLGAIVHNEEELSRLASSGLITIDSAHMSEAGGSALLIRAHGEPPVTYARANELGCEVIDCTCPVVLQLQKAIRQAYARLAADPRKGRLVIFGKVGHAEVLGLVGQVGGDALVVENEAMLKGAIELGDIPLDGPVELFSQTTKSPDEFARICTLLRERLSSADLLSVHDTVCSQVASRHSGLEAFARAHDIIVFVAGKESSNGKVLCNLCRSVNIRTYQIGSAAALKREWFNESDVVGVCGATSTPKWLLEEVASAIENFAK